MVRLTKIYTRGGDSGETSLGDGSRVAKHSARVEAYGTIDEANSTIGLARMENARASSPKLQTDALLNRIQNDLFDLGADLCTPEDGRLAESSLRVIAAQVEHLETEIDRINGSLNPLESFILPGGTPLAAYLHLARTVTRRAERLVAELSASEPINPELIKYLNRLSDLLFVLSRDANNNGKDDVLWVPGANR